MGVENRREIEVGNSTVLDICQSLCNLHSFVN